MPEEKKGIDTHGYVTDNGEDRLNVRGIERMIVADRTRRIREGLGNSYRGGFSTQGRTGEDEIGADAAL